MSVLHIVDADSHYVEIPDEWAGFLSVAERDAFGPSLVVGDDGVERFGLGSRFSVPPVGVGLFGGMSIADGNSPRPRGGGARMEGRRLGDLDPSASQAQARLALMDEEGIAASVVFPTLTLSALPSLGDPTAVSALARAANDWAAERWVAPSARLLPAAAIPLDDPAWAAKELERSARELGFRVAWVSPVPAVNATLATSEHDAVWDVAAALGIPVIVHYGNGAGGPRALGRERSATWMSNHAMGYPFEAMAAIAALYSGGVFDRFPTLRFGFFDAGTGWLPYWIAELEFLTRRMGWIDATKLPAQSIREVFADRCAVTSIGADEFVTHALDAVGSGSVVWGSAFPRYTCEMPVTATLRARDDVDEQQRTALAGAAASDFFGIAEPLESI